MENLLTPPKFHRFPNRLLRQRDVMPLYSQGYSLARFLMAQGGKRAFLDYISDGLRDENWSRATKQHYGFDNLRTLQDSWLAWVKQGSPDLNVGPKTAPLVAVKTPANPPGPGPGRRNGDAPFPGPSTSTVAANVGPSVYDVASNRGALAGSSPRNGDATWRARGSKSSELAPNARPAKAAAIKHPGPQHQVTRPQELQRPQQVILEWNRPPGTNASSTAARPLPGPL